MIFVNVQLGLNLILLYNIHGKEMVKKLNTSVCLPPCKITC